MMKLAAALCLCFAALGAAPALADDDGLTPAIAQCLRDNAAKVEAAEPDLTKATDYLVSSVCAAPVAEEQRRLNAIRMQQMADRNRAQCRDRVAQQKQQDAGATPPRMTRTYENCELNYSNMIANSSGLPVIFGLGARPPAAVSMAAKLILDLRVAHNKPRP